MVRFLPVAVVAVRGNPGDQQLWALDKLVANQAR
jgi:hypothetical protein